MFGFNTLKQNCTDGEGFAVRQSAGQHTAASKYWTNLASNNGTVNTSIEQDPMQTASFYKDSSN